MNVLLVEDNKVESRLFSRIIQRMGHEVECVFDGQDASDKMKACLYDTVVLDLRLPHIHGSDLLVQLAKNEFKGNPAVIVLTAHPDELVRVFRPGAREIVEPEAVVEYLQRCGVICQQVNKPDIDTGSLERALEECGRLVRDRGIRSLGADICDQLLKEGKIRRERGKIAVVDIRSKTGKVFPSEKQAIAYAKRVGPRRTYFRYFNSKLARTLEIARA